MADIADAPKQDVPEPHTAHRLRDALARELADRGIARDPRLLAALRIVPRHLAAPDADIVAAYRSESAVITKTDGHGTHLSSVSAPRVQAMQIEQAEIEPGMRVLEIGSGGVNAAYLAAMVGEHGHVVTVDIDADVTARAARFLTESEHDRNVTVVTADAEYGVAEHGPYDRIVVTVQAADIPPAWMAQLHDGGRLVVPLRMRGMTRSVAFVRKGRRLVSDGLELCGFVPMQGAGENRVRLAVLHEVEGEEIALRLDGHPEPDTPALRQALHGSATRVWTGVTVGGMESKDPLDLWLTSALDNLPLMAAQSGARQRGLVDAISPMGIPTLVDDGNLAYRTSRRTDAPDRWELGAVGHGPEAEKTAERLAEAIRIWDREYRAGHPRVEVHPAGTPNSDLPAGRVIDRRHTRITLSWL